MSGGADRGAAAARERRQAARAWLLAPSPEGRVRVKLCGMSREQDVDAVEELRPDLCGFIVDFPKSHRSVSPERVAQLCARMDAAEAQAAGAADVSPVWRVGVFVDKPAEEVVHIVHDSGLDLAQLHGHEDAAYVAALRAADPDLGIIQAFRVREPKDVARACESEADLVLLDKGQGTGEAFDWSLAKLATRPFMLAGGLGPENVAAAIGQVHPWGVDMSSGIETDKLKDPPKMRDAVAAVRGCA